ncbi:MAG: glucose-1-phosphate adenylyltransferase subunit GlgD [Candidatus Epulonipiscioides saccharophilum]|nr:MAG: glucose-1-phosphate adenylyltransferase subunit GlgD [Epulopiscium sp. AS2M-Bin001]
MRAIGIILAGSKKDGLGVLASHRNNAAMPIGGAYKVIDFTLTNMSESGIKSVAVISQYNTRSLSDHISSSKWWNFGRKNSGIFLFTPDMLNADSFSFKGTADAIYQNLHFLKKSTEPYVVVTPADHVLRIDYRDVIQYHIDQQADISVVYQEYHNADLSNYGVMELDENRRLLNFEEKPLEPQSNNISLGIYVFERKLLIALLEEIANDGRYSIVDDIIIRYRKRLKIYGYKFNGYWKTLKNIKALYETNMDFLNPQIKYEIFEEKSYVYTKAKDDPPVKYSRECSVRNSILNGGDIINGNVENSVLSRKVFVGEGAYIRNSVIMEGCTIGRDAIVENAILDKNVLVSSGQRVIGALDDIKVIGKDHIV